MTNEFSYGVEEEEDEISLSSALLPRGLPRVKGQMKAKWEEGS